MFVVFAEYNDCTVQILEDPETGEQSLGWWRNDSPPEVAAELDN